MTEQARQPAPLPDDPALDGLIDGIGFDASRGRMADDLAAEVITAITALRAENARLKAQEVRVKPLQWVGRNGFWRASDPIGGFYEICEIKGEAFLTRIVSGAGSALVPYPTIEAAKATAEADHEARIRAALEGGDPCAK